MHLQSTLTLSSSAFNRQQQILTILLVVGLLLQPLLPLLPAPAFAPATPMTRPAVSPAGDHATTAPAPTAAPTALAAPNLLSKPEVIERREEFARHYDLGDGKFVALVSPTPLNYQDADGEWQPIQTQFEATEGGWRIAHNSLRSVLDARSTIVSLESRGVTVAWRPEALTAVSTTGATQLLATPLAPEQAAPGQLAVNGRTVHYPRGWSDASLSEQFHSRAGALEQELVLAQPPQATVEAQWLTLRAHLLAPAQVQLFADGQLQPDEFTTTGTVELHTPAGELLLAFDPPVAYEQADPHVQVAGRYHIVRTQHQIELSVQTPWSWWSNPQRRYPAVLDPTMRVVRDLENGSLLNRMLYLDGEPPDPPLPALPLAVLKNQTCVGNTVEPLGDDAAWREYSRGYVRFPLPTLPYGVPTPTGALMVAVADPLNGSYPNASYIASIARQPTHLLAMKQEWTDLLLNSNGTLPPGAFPDMAAPSGNWSDLAFIWKPAPGSDAGNGPLPAASWDVTTIVQGWYADPATNHGFGLRLYHEGFYAMGKQAVLQSNSEIPFTVQRWSPSVPNGMCFPSEAQWTSLNDVVERLQTKDLGSATADGAGLGLLVVYEAFALTANSTVDTKVPSVKPDGYYQTQYHEYKLPASGTQWQIVAAGGLRPPDNQRAKTILNLVDSQGAPVGGPMGSSDAAAATGASAPAKWHPNYIAVHGDQGELHVQVAPDDQPVADGHDDKRYRLQTVTAAPSPNLGPPGNPNPTPLTIPITFQDDLGLGPDFNDLVQGQELNFVANTTVEIRVPYVTLPTDYLFPLDQANASLYNLQVFPPTLAVASRVHGGIALQAGVDSYEVEFQVEEGMAGPWLLAIMNNYPHREDPHRTFRIEVTVCQNDANVVRYPLDGQCVELHRPIAAQLNDPAYTITLGSGANALHVHSPAGFEEQGNGVFVTKPVDEAGTAVMPLLGYGNDQVNWVALKNGSFSVNKATNTVVTSDHARLVMADFSSTQFIRSLPVLRGRFQAILDNEPNRLQSISLPAETEVLIKTPVDYLDDNDAEGDKNGWRYEIEMQSDRLRGYGQLMRSIQPTVDGVTTQFAFAAVWSITVQGAPSLQGELHSLSITPKADLDVGSLLVTVPTMVNHYTLEYDPGAVVGVAAAAVPPFQQLRITGAIVGQAANVGGAKLPVQAVILNPYAALLDLDNPDADQQQPTIQRGRDVFDLRGPGDQRTATQIVIDRAYQMPDMIITGPANTVAINAGNQLEVFSSDHPLAAALTNGAANQASFSYETFGASVRTFKGECAPPDPFGQGTGNSTGPITTIIQGHASMSLPNAESESGGGVIAVDFTLCENSLRELKFFLSTGSDLALPMGTSGLWLHTIYGTISLSPPGAPNDYVQIKLGMGFRGFAMNNAGSMLFTNAEVTIDTRGLLDVQLHAGVDFTALSLGMDGHFWVAWSPLDIGFELKGCLPLDGNPQEPGANAMCVGEEFIFGMLRGHFWQGQGWQHRYPWLEDNDAMHAAARFEAKIQIKAGSIIDEGIFVVPPFSTSFGIKLAFGEFCTNDACTQYEWGAMGALVVLGYDVGFYFGFDSGPAFILGSADYLLIDEAGQAVVHTAGVPPVRLQPQGTDVNQTITILPGVPSALFIVGWVGSSPIYDLRDPDGVMVNPPLSSAAVAADSLSSAALYPNATITQTPTAAGAQLVIAVKHPKAGAWKVRLAKPDASTQYKFFYSANKPPPLVNFAPLPNAVVNNPTTIPLHWTSNVAVDDGARLSLYYHIERPHGVSITSEVAGPIVQWLPLTQQGSYDWDVTALASGRYTLTMRIDNSAGVVVNQCGDQPYQPQVAAQPPCGTMLNPKLFMPVTEEKIAGHLVIIDTIAPAAPLTADIRPEGISNVVVSWQPSRKANGDPEKDLAGYIVTCLQGQGLTQLTRRVRVSAKLPHDTTLFEEAQVNGLFGEPATCTVQAYDASGNLSGPSPVVVATPSNDIPAGPPAVPAVNVVSLPGSATLNWQPAPGAVGYLLYYLLADNSNAAQISDSSLAGPLSALLFARGNRAVEGRSPIKVGNVTSFTLSGLTAGQTYQAWVRPYDEDGRRGPRSTPVEFTFRGARSDQTISFALLPDRLLGDPPFTLNATSSSGLPVTFTSSTPAVCTVAENIVTLVAPGLCTVVAAQAGNENFNAAEATQSFVVAPVPAWVMSVYLPLIMR